MPTWPSTVPHEPTLAAKRVVSPMSPRLRSDMEAGNTRFRRAASVDLAKLPYEIVMTWEQLEDFRDFVHDDLNGGADAFDMPVWTPGGCVTKSCKLSGDEPYQAAARNGGRYSVVFELSVLDWAAG